jgi:hypothetical protein
MADLKQKYGSKVDMTMTLASLADAGARESTAVDNGTNLFNDVQVGGFLKAGASGVSATGYVNIWAYASADDGTTYSDAATGTDSAHTLNGNAVLLGVVELNANAETAEFGLMSIAQAFGGAVPEDWGIIIENQSGAALDSTEGNHDLHYKGIHYQSV